LSAAEDQEQLGARIHSQSRRQRPQGVDGVRRAVALELDRGDRPMGDARAAPARASPRDPRRTRAPRPACAAAARPDEHDGVEPETLLRRRRGVQVPAWTGSKEPP
jgi:hypothetical protein